MRTEESSKLYATPTTAMAMFNMVFVGVVPGVWGDNFLRNTFEILIRTLLGGVLSP